MADAGGRGVMGLQLQARAAGFAYLVIIFAAPFSEMFVRRDAIERGDAAATAANILGNEGLWRLAFVSDLLVVACDVLVAVLLYNLLKPAGRSISLMAAFFRLALVVASAFKVIMHFAPLYILQGQLPSFTPDQAEAISYVALRMHGAGYSIALFFFAFHCLLIGWLISKATFLPRVIGWLLMFAGVCYLVNAVAGYVAPDLSRMLFPWILLPALPAEGGLALWLVIMGVNREKWKAQATT